QKEKLMEQRITCRNKLQSESHQTSNAFASNEIKTQIAQLDAEINELKNDIEELQNSTKLNSSENMQSTSAVDEGNLREEEVARKKEIERLRREQEKMKKMKEQRECIITELLQTERDYISDLKLLQDTFLRNPEEAKEKGIDIVILFGNLDEVVEVASRLLRRLQKVSKETGLIGECFVDVGEEMKEAYGHYCRNHDEAHSVIDKIDVHSSAGQYINQKLEILKMQTNCFDLPAMLIKPVQRILKYPLLLNELLKCTEDGHPDKPALLQAVNLMTDVATAVNEFKRKKDLVFKYRKQADTSLSGRISKLNMHSVAKKSSRLGMRLSSSFGLKTLVKDQEFEKVAKRFHSLDKTLKIFQKEVCEYSKKYEELVACGFNIAEDIADIYQERKSQQEVDQFRSVHRVILTQFWESFKQNIERNVNSPIKMLLQAFRGPINLIHKRHDKLLDSLSATSKMEKNRDVTKIKMLQESCTMAKNNYEALNSQLLDDLPRLCDLSVEILYDCIRCFLRAKKNFIGRASMQLFGLMDLPLLLGNRNTSILETFQVKHTLVTDDLCQISLAQKPLQTCIKTDTLKRNSSPRGSRLSFGGVNPILKSQTSSQKAAVKSAFPHTALYTACENFEAADIMDISLKKGNLVGVIKQQDPMGNRLRWFVDDGDSKGFVPAKCLIKHIPDPSSPTDDSKFCSNINSTSAAASGSKDVQKLYSLPQKKNPEAKTQPKQTNVVQPIRPAPTIASSLRVVAPSRYPPTTQNAASNPQQNASAVSAKNFSLSKNDNNEPMHRYEEINESADPREQSARTCDTDKNSSRDPNILDEFDPYSTGKLPEVYDNVPDNLNCLYGSHRYEDVPDITYDEVPQEDAGVGSGEYYYAMYDFSPTGPNQQPLYKGQVVLVLHKCDLNSNSEWWFIEDRHGNKGYVPGAYLNKYLKDV
ncbi:rho guanine nucleotide exchange factor 38-like, partial [Uloborus diversus]|uniref:rho guanine nucleotide exchange factor 38-like n=1 Tax=Uloborus diversus TaxID=327109 RepID=UPI0024092E7F